jgi:hypothetical protein
LRFWPANYIYSLLTAQVAQQAKAAGLGNGMVSTAAARDADERREAGEVRSVCFSRAAVADASSQVPASLFDRSRSEILHLFRELEQSTSCDALTELITRFARYSTHFGRALRQSDPFGMKVDQANLALLFLHSVHGKQLAAVEAALPYMFTEEAFGFYRECGAFDTSAHDVAARLLSEWTQKHVGMHMELGPGDMPLPLHGDNVLYLDPLPMSGKVEYYPADGSMIAEDDTLKSVTAVNSLHNPHVIADQLMAIQKALEVGGYLFNFTKSPCHATVLLRECLQAFHHKKMGIFEEKVNNGITVFIYKKSTNEFDHDFVLVSEPRLVPLLGVNVRTGKECVLPLQMMRNCKDADHRGPAGVYCLSTDPHAEGSAGFRHQLAKFDALDKVDKIRFRDSRIKTACAMQSAEYYGGSGNMNARKDTHLSGTGSCCSTMKVLPPEELAKASYSYVATWHDAHPSVLDALGYNPSVGLLAALNFMVEQNVLSLAKRMRGVTGTGIPPNIANGQWVVVGYDASAGGNANVAAAGYTEARDGSGRLVSVNMQNASDACAAAAGYTEARDGSGSLVSVNAQKRGDANVTAAGFTESRDGSGRKVSVNLQNCGIARTADFVARTHRRHKLVMKEAAEIHNFGAFVTKSGVGKFVMSWFYKQVIKRIMAKQHVDFTGADLKNVYERHADLRSDLLELIKKRSGLPWTAFN